MCQKKIKNIPASIKARLLNRAKESGFRPNEVWQRYAMERFLYRLSVSEYQEKYTLKGALLLHIWLQDDHRSTQDIDFCGTGNATIPYLEAVIREICQQEVSIDDGLYFDPSTVKGSKIKEDQDYEGVRLVFKAFLGHIPIPVQIDVGFGDALSEAPKLEQFPTLINLPHPLIRTYPKETVIAEKFSAMVELGIKNSRMKDFYDIWVLSKAFEFQGDKLYKAIEATFKKREMDLPTNTPFAFTPNFYAFPAKATQWNAFIRKQEIKIEQRFENIIADLKSFIMPLLEARDKAFEKSWNTSQWMEKIDYLNSTASTTRCSSDSDGWV